MRGGSRTTLTWPCSPPEIASLLAAVVVGRNGEFEQGIHAGKNEFGRILDAAALSGPVVITKHHERRAALLSFGDYAKLMGPPEPELDLLTNEFDELLARMQSPAAKNSARSLFSMSSGELGEAAVDAVKKVD